MAKIENQTTLYKQNVEAIQSKLTECGFEENLPIYAIPDAIDGVLGLHKVFVCARSGTLYTKEQIQKMTVQQVGAMIPAVRGILLCAEGHRLLIAPTDAFLPDEETGGENYKLFWGGYGFDTSMVNVTGQNGILEQSGKTAALLDYEGYSKTQIMKVELEDAQVITPAGSSAEETKMQTGSEVYRAISRYEELTQISGGEKGWYLPSAGELSLIYRNLDDVHNLMDTFNNKLGIAMFTRFTTEYYWSSSEGSSTDAWLVGFGNGSLLYNYGKFYQYRARAVAAF